MIIMLANNSENRLTHLLGAYNSDSDGDECDEKETNQENHGNNDGNADNTNIVFTDWTKCLDKNTGHPYFWNISTKEVTWEMPQEYKCYLEYVERSNFGENAHRWKAYKSEDTNVPYYVDEVTRVVSWDMPEEYKKHVQAQKVNNIKKAPEKIDKNVRKKPAKKYPEHLTKLDPIEEKIELISSYSMSSGSSSEDEDTHKKTEALKFKETKNHVEMDLPKKPVIPSEELLPYKMYTPDPASELQSTENQASSSILFNNETSITLSELEKTYNSTAVAQRSPDMTTSDVKPPSTSDENIDKKLLMRKRRIEIPRFAPKVIEQESPQTCENSADGMDEEKPKVSVYGNFISGGTEFARSSNGAEDDIHIEPEQKKEVQDAATSTTEDEEVDGEDIKDLSSLVGAKVKFLSEGRPIVSGVQIMQIQLETLVSAYDAHQLSRSYVMNWLNTTAKTLLQLETDVAPNGWRCKWDRTNSRYYYQSLITGKIQWDFPEPDVSCVGEEMEICTTPPHPGADTDEPTSKKAKKNEEEEIRPPEPPAWDSSPEPPPPPPFPEAPPPPRITDKFHSELDSFYSDLATLETTSNISDSATTTSASEEVTSLEQEKTTTKQTRSSPTPQTSQDQVKPTKKKKVKTSRTEMKEMSLLMAKWQKAQQDLKK